MTPGIPFFFFSSRRRHTSFDCDWSSDVCSSDLDTVRGPPYCRRLAALGLVIGSGQVVQMTPNPGSSFSNCEKRSEEHTSELQSQSNLVCRLLLEKKMRAVVHIRHELDGRVHQYR